MNLAQISHERTNYGVSKYPTCRGSRIDYARAMWEAYKILDKLPEEYYCLGTQGSLNEIKGRLLQEIDKAGCTVKVLNGTRTKVVGNGNGY